MATQTRTSRHPGEPLAEGRNAPGAHRDRRHDPHLVPPPSGATPTGDARGTERGGRRRPVPIRVSEIDARLWFG